MCNDTAVGHAFLAVGIAGNDCDKREGAFYS